MMKFLEGQEVHVHVPYKTYDEQWFIPGERIFVLEDRDGRGNVRIRCGASGADAWVPRELLLVTMDNILTCTIPPCGVLNREAAPA
jgi:hypothetical protein